MTQTRFFLVTGLCAMSAIGCGAATERSAGEGSESTEPAGAPEPKASESDAVSEQQTPVASARLTEPGSCDLPAFIRDLGPGHHALPSDIATDASGNVLHARHPILGEPQGQLTKLAPDGSELWNRPYGSAVATDALGNVAVAGSFAPGFDPGSGALKSFGGTDVFVAKLSPDGKLSWATSVGTVADDVPRSIAAHSSGVIAVSAKGAGTFVYAPDGTLRWEKPYSGALAFDAGGNLLVTGGFVGAIDLGTGPVVSGGASDAFVVKLSPHGQHLMSHVIGGGNDVDEQMGTAIAAGPDGEIVIAGELEGGITLFGEQHEMPTAGEQGQLPGAYIAKLDATGQPRWSQVAIGVEDMFDLSTDATGNSFVAGSLVGDVAPFRQTFVQKLDSDGNVLFEHAELPTDTSGLGASHAVATDACGKAFWSLAVRIDDASPAEPTRALVVRLGQ